ncbi:MAG: hypothetical protein ACI4L6_00680 [Candidatus Onthoplasma sp.]
MQGQKRFTLSLVVATIVILLAIFLHVTFAYFTATGTRKGELQFAVLNINILSSTDGNNFTSLDDSTFTTRYFKNVEPGSTINLNNLQVKNTSDVSVYALVKLNVEVSATDADTISYTEWYNLTGTRVETSNFSVNTTGATLLGKNKTSNFAISFVLDGERFDNTYQNATVKTTLSAFAVQSNLRDSDMYVDEAQYAAYFIIKDDVSYVSLPEDYTQVEYIESTGTQYIDTGYIGSNNTSLEIKQSFLYEQSVASYSAIGSAGNNNDRIEMGYNSMNNQFWCNTGSTTSRFATGFAVDMEPHVFSWDGSGYFAIDDYVAFAKNTISTAFECTTSLYLFKDNQRMGYYCPVKTYYCKIWDNGTLVRNMIPCYRNSDNKVGMYDMVNNVFYTNAGTGEFQYIETSSYSFTGKIYGNSVQSETPSPTNPVEIQSVGEKTKNLFNWSAIKNTNIIVSENGQKITMPILTQSNSNGYTGTQSKFSELFPDLQVGDTATLSFNSNAEIKKIYLNTPKLTWAAGETLTITEDIIDSNVVFYGNYYAHGQTEQVVISDFQMELGSTATDYEPYGYKVPVTLNDGTTQNIYIKEPLRKVGAYADYIDFNTNTVVRNVGYKVLNGSESWTTMSYTYEYSISKSSFSNIDAPSSTKNLLCDSFVVTTSTAKTIGQFRAGSSYLNFNYDNGEAGIDNFKTWLSGNNITVYYKLLTPTVEQIETPILQSNSSEIDDWGLTTDTTVQTTIDWIVKKLNSFQTKSFTHIELNGYPLMKTDSVADSLTTNSEGKAVLTRNVGTYVFTGDETFTLSNGEYVFSKSSIDGINSSSTDLKCSHFDLTSSTGTIKTFRVDSSSIYFNYDNGAGGIDGFEAYLKDRYSKGDPVVIAYPLQTSTTSTISPTNNLYSGEQTLTFETGNGTNNTDGTIYIEGDDVLNCVGKTLVVSYKLRRYEDDGWTDSTYPPFVGYSFYDSNNDYISNSQQIIYLDNYTMTSNDGSWTYLWFTIDVSDSDISKIAIQLAGGGTSAQYRHYDIKQIKVEVGIQPSL